MKIIICGSIAFYDEMQQIKKKLESMGHEVKLPPSEIRKESGEMIPVKEYYRLRKETETTDGWIWDAKEKAIRTHFNKIEWGEKILVLNYDKKNIKNYIGGNTLLEMALAFYLRKPIYLFSPIPEISYKSMKGWHRKFPGIIAAMKRFQQDKKQITTPAKSIPITPEAKKIVQQLLADTWPNADTEQLKQAVEESLQNYTDFYAKHRQYYQQEQKHYKAE